MSNEQLTLQELLALEPLTDFQVIAGWSRRKNKICGLVDLNSLTEDGAGKLLVLDGEKEVSRQWKEIWAQAIKQDLAGILLLGPAHHFGKNHLPKDSPLPVIHLPCATFRQVQQVYELATLLKRQGYFLPWLQSANGHWLRLLNEKGLSSLMTHLEVILENRTLLVDPLFEPLNLPAYEPRDKAYWQNLLPKLHQQYRRQGSNAGKQNLQLFRIEHYYLCPLRTNGTILGFLVVEEMNPLDELNLIQLQQAVPPLVTELLKYQEVLEANQKYQDHFIYDLLHNNFESHKSLIQLGKIWDWDLSKPHYLFLIDYKGTQRGELTTLWPLAPKKIITRTMPQAIVSVIDEQLVVMVPAEQGKSRGERKKQQKALAQKMLDVICAQYPQDSLFIGIGKFYPSTADLCRSYQEAKTALELGRLSYLDKQIYHFEDLGIVALLSHIRYEQLHDYSQEFLADLIAFDRENKTNLLETLKVYLALNGDAKETAAKLYIHPNTLRYRLNKVEELLDVDLHNWDDLVNLYVALKIQTMLLTLFES